MQLDIKGNDIFIKDATTFEPKAILNSGQCFRWGECEVGFWVQSADKYAIINKIGIDSYKICTDNVKFWLNYFDFSQDYDTIITRLTKEKELAKVLLCAKGVRVLRQPLLEIIVTFIISANNNITRIRNSVMQICRQFGTKINGHFAFPTLPQLLQISIQDFVNFGCGYRAKYLYQTIHQIQQENVCEKLCKMDTASAKKYLKTLAGIGPKVADCILLFGLQKNDVFPVDTWIEKVYHQEYGGKEKNREKIADFFVNKYGDLSGVVQQYLFYYKRQSKNI